MMVVAVNVMKGEERIKIFSRLIFTTFPPPPPSSSSLVNLEE